MNHFAVMVPQDPNQARSETFRYRLRVLVNKPRFWKQAAPAWLLKPNRAREHYAAHQKATALSLENALQ